MTFLVQYKIFKIYLLLSILFITQPKSKFFFILFRVGYVFLKSLSTKHKNKFEVVSKNNLFHHLLWMRSNVL